jgi:hypothetical protein
VTDLLKMLLAGGAPILSFALLALLAYGSYRVVKGCVGASDELRAFVQTRRRPSVCAAGGPGPVSPVWPTEPATPLLTPSAAAADWAANDGTQVLSPLVVMPQARRTREPRPLPRPFVPTGAR